MQYMTQLITYNAYLSILSFADYNVVKYISIIHNPFNGGRVGLACNDVVENIRQSNMHCPMHKLQRTPRYGLSTSKLVAHASDTPIYLSH